VKIDAALVAQLVSRQFPAWSGLAIRAVANGGWDNRTFRLGESMSVRLPSAAHYAAQVDKEQTWLPRLADRLPLPIPTPIARGAPDAEYPWAWSVYRWIDGECASPDRIADLRAFALDLARFLRALQCIDPLDAPRAGAHNFWRGGALSTYDVETRGAAAALRATIDERAAIALWDAALRADWRGSPVWLHGDVAASNLLVRAGRLAAVIDFGCCAVGDPACDTTIAWTLFEGESRRAFRSALGVDDDTWLRGGAWALWKALITRTRDPAGARVESVIAERVIAEVLNDLVGG
jgi:aminoglycoside phosphotransferase (APT) family kinase protein